MFMLGGNSITGFAHSKLNRIWVHVGPFKFEQSADIKRQVNEKGEPLIMVLKPHVGFEVSHQDIVKGRVRPNEN